MAAEKTPSLPAAQRTLQVLEEVARSEGGLTLAQLTQRLGAPRSSLHCLLVTLERSGYLERGARKGRYVFGPGLFRFANAALRGQNLRVIATPFLRALAHRTQLTAHIAVLDHDQVVLIGQESASAGKLATWLGQSLDCHCTALGKALIAYLPEEYVQGMTRAHGLPRHNENTIVSLRRLAEELAATRRRGYAVDDEENMIGARCLAVPVFNVSGVVLASVSLMGSVEQLEPVRFEPLAAELKEVAGGISGALGAVLAGPRESTA